MITPEHFLRHLVPLPRLLSSQARGEELQCPQLVLISAVLVSCCCLILSDCDRNAEQKQLRWRKLISVPWFKTWSASLLGQSVMAAGAMVGALFLGGQKQRMEEHRKGQGDSVLASPVTYFLQLRLTSLPPAPSDATTQGS